MLKLIRFEIKKLLKSSFTFSMLILFLFALSFYYSYSYIKTERIDKEIRSTEMFLEGNQQQLASLEEELEENPDLKNRGEFLQELQLAEAWVDLHERKLAALKNDDWSTILEDEIERDTEGIERIESEYNPYPNHVKWATDFTERVHYYRMIYLLEHDISPVLPYSIFGELTVYDRSFDDDFLKEIIKVTSNKYSSSSFYFLYRSLEIIFSLAGIVFFVFLFGDIITKEGLNRYGPINFLSTQPLSSSKILSSKFLTVLIKSVIILLITGFFSLLLGLIFDHVGAWNYPVLIYEPDLEFHFMPLLSFVGVSSLLFFMLLTFSYSLLFFFSILTKRAVLAIGFTLGILLLGIMYSGEPDTSFAAYNPFHYLKIYDIVSMKTAAMHENFQMTWKNGFLSLASSSLVILLGSFGLIRLN